MLVDFGLPLHFWNKAISTMVYVKNKSSFSAIRKGKITPKEAFLQQDFPRINHLRIYGFMTLVFDEDPMSKLHSKAWKD